MASLELNQDNEVTYKPEFFEALYELEAHNFWFRGRNQLIIWALQKFFPNAQSFLEIGCGTGFVLAGIQKANPTLQLAGSELFAEGLAFAKKRLDSIDLFELDARDLHMENSFDVIGAFDVIEHIDEDSLVLQQLHKAAKTGILLSVPQHMFLWSAVDELSCHKRRYSLAELVAKTENAGFEVTYTNSFVTLLLPLLLLARRNKRTDEKFDLLSELKLPTFVNFGLEQIMAIERWLIKAGIQLPAGGSLLLAAKKR